MLLGVQVGPKGVHVEKDNVFNSQAYAAGAPSITIGNDPSATSSSLSTPYSGAVAQAPSANTYQNNQNTQSTYSTTDQAASSSSSGAGTQGPPAHPVPPLSHPDGNVDAQTLDYVTDRRCPLPALRSLTVTKHLQVWPRLHRCPQGREVAAAAPTATQCPPPAATRKCSHQRLCQVRMTTVQHFLLIDS